MRARWHHQSLSLWLQSLHHSESKPQLPHSNKLHTIPQKHRNAGNQQLEPYDISFFPLFLVFALPLALGKGILQQLELDQAAVALLWHCCDWPGWHPPGQPALLGLGMPGTPCSSMVFICFVATARPTSEAGRETWPISHWVGSREGESGSLWGPFSGRGSTLPQPLFIQYPWAGYQSLPVKISFGTRKREREPLPRKNVVDRL